MSKALQVLRRCRSGQTGHVKAVLAFACGGSNPPLLIVKGNKKMEKIKKTSKTRIESRMRKKSCSNLVTAIIHLKKTNPDIAKELSKPKRRWSSVNLKELSHIDGDLVVPGKVLSAGDIPEKKKIVAWSFSEKAKEKILQAKGNAILLSDEIKDNPQLNGLSMVR